MAPLTIPQDVVHIIIIELKTDQVSLINGSLVSRSFCDACRRYLFARIVLNSAARKRVKAFHTILESNPRLRLYIRDLDLIIQGGRGGRMSPELPDVLRKLDNLRCLFLEMLQMEPRAWESLHPSLRPSLIERLKSPRLTTLKISNLSFFPLSLLAGCVDLKTLILSEALPPSLIYHEVELESTPSVKIKALLQSLTVTCTLNTIDSFAPTFVQLLSSVDLSHLRQLQVGSMRRDSEMEESQKVIELSSGFLEELTLITKFIEVPPNKPLNVSAMKCLRNLTITIVEKSYMLRWLDSALANFKGNILEKFVLHITGLILPEEEQRDIDVALTEIDRTLTNSNFTHLYCMDVFLDTPLATPHPGLPFVRERLPNLVSKGIAFFAWNNWVLFPGDHTIRYEPIRPDILDSEQQ